MRGRGAETAENAELLLGVLDQSGEGVGLERGAADETAVDVLLSGQSSGVLGLHAAAVLDNRVLGDFSAEHVGQSLADERVGLLRHFRGSGLARSDRPDRLVGNRDVRHVGGGEVGETALELDGENVVRLAAFALGEGLSDADDRLEFIFQSGFDALVDGLVGFAEVLSALAVTDNDVFHADFLQHRAGDFTGERAVVRPVNVLSADFDVRALQDFNRGRKAGEGRADSHGDRVAELGEAFLESFRESFRLGGSLVHFPVSGDKGFACHFAEFLIVGCWLFHPVI